VSEASRPAHSPRTAFRLVCVASAALLLLVAAWWVWTAVRAVETATQLLAADAATTRLSAAVTAGDRDAATAAGAALAGELSAAADTADDPIWVIAARAPVVGGDIDALRTLLRSLRPLASESTPLVAALASGTWDQSVDLTPLVQDAERARTALAHIDTAPLLPPVGRAVERVRDALEQGVPVLRTAAAVEPLLRALDGPAPTRILVLLQNNAEVRTGGGITGSFLQITSQAGVLTLDAQASSSDFAPRATPVADVPPDLATLYGDVVGRFVQNTTIPADFAVSARLASAWWQSRGGAAPDLIVSVDPLVLAAALQVIGPVQLADGSTLTSGDAIDRLLVEPYRALDADGQTALMQDAAARVFAGLAAAPADPLTWMSALSGPIASGSISAWAADADTQDALSRGLLGGPSARLAAAGPDAFGLWLNDATGGKMDGYLDIDIATTVASCRPDGRADIAVQLTMSSTAPADAAHSLPGDVTGHGMYGTAVGDIGTSVAVAAPPGTFLVSVSKDGASLPVATAVESGRPTSLVRVNLSPGERNEIRFAFVAAEPGAVAPEVVHTPLLNVPDVTAPVIRGCD